MRDEEKKLYTLTPLEDFKAILGIDDREDKLARFCLISSTYSIEQYCKRKLLRKKHFETVQYAGDIILPIKEYPVNKIQNVYLMRDWGLRKSNWDLLNPDFYTISPDCGTEDDVPYFLSLYPSLKNYRGLYAVKIIYYAGFPAAKIPADLASACLELASWNMSRYKGRRIGTTGNIRGAGKDGEHFELSMPENVKHLLEPYRRKTI